MQASEQSADREDESGELPLDELLDDRQIPYYDDDDDDDEASSKEETASEDAFTFSAVFCRWGNCRKMFKTGTYLCIDVKLFMAHIERDHIDLLPVEDGEKVQCLWGFNLCHKEIAREEILEHVEEHFMKDEDTLDAYPDSTPTPEQWVYCLWKECRQVFVDQDIGNIWWGHIWAHVQEDYGPTDATTKIPCEWIGCESSEEFGSRTIAQHTKKHLRDNMQFNIS